MISYLFSTLKYELNHHLYILQSEGHSKSNVHNDDHTSQEDIHYCCMSFLQQNVNILYITIHSLENVEVENFIPSSTDLRLNMFHL